MTRFVTFGEVMLRLTPPGKDLILQTPFFKATPGGAEANVAVSLANYGENVAYVTALPPSNPIAESIISDIGKSGVDTSFIRRSGSRVGLYFTQTGSAMRPSKVIYDRTGSSIADVRPGDFDWDRILDGAQWFHVTGITPAIAEGTSMVTFEALEKCREKGITVSCDLNYRKKLWKWGKQATEVMTEVARYIDVMIANEEDCQKCLGIDLDVDVSSGELDVSKYRKLSSIVMDRYPNVKFLAVSLRESVSADNNNWSGVLASRDGFFESKKYPITDIVDRIGGGDAFGAGLIYGLVHFESEKDAIEFAVAASALKHTIYGDFNRVSKEDVLALMEGDSSGRVQR